MNRSRKLRFLLVVALSRLVAGCITDPYAPGYGYGYGYGYGEYPAYPGYGYYDSAWGPYYGPFFWPDYSYYPVCSPFCGGFYGNLRRRLSLGAGRRPGPWLGPSGGSPAPAGPGVRPGMAAVRGPTGEPARRLQYALCAAIRLPIPAGASEASGHAGNRPLVL